MRERNIIHFHLFILAAVLAPLALVACGSGEGARPAGVPLRDDRSLYAPASVVLDASSIRIESADVSNSPSPEMTGRIGSSAALSFRVRLGLRDRSFPGGRLRLYACESERCANRDQLYSVDCTEELDCDVLDETGRPVMKGRSSSRGGAYRVTGLNAVLARRSDAETAGLREVQAPASTKPAPETQEAPETLDGESGPAVEGASERQAEAGPETTEPQIDRPRERQSFATSAYGVSIEFVDPRLIEGRADFAYLGLDFVPNGSTIASPRPRMQVVRLPGR